MMAISMNIVWKQSRSWDLLALRVSVTQLLPNSGVRSLFRLIELLLRATNVYLKCLHLEVQSRRLRCDTFDSINEVLL